MIIYLVTAPGHENTGYGDGILEGGHPTVLVSFLEFADNSKKLAGFRMSTPKEPVPAAMPRRPVAD